jgi:hypothetical protein
LDCMVTGVFLLVVFHTLRSQVWVIHMVRDGKSNVKAVFKTVVYCHH